MSGARCDMKRKKSKPIGNDSPANLVASGANNDELADCALQKASADYYERRWRDKIKEHRSDFWIVLGLYLVLSSVAVVIL